jgi:hypothetical protein
MSLNKVNNNTNEKNLNKNKKRKKPKKRINNLLRDYILVI